MSQSNDRLHSHAGQGGTRLIPALERWRQEDQGVQSQPWLPGQLCRGEGSVDSCLLTGWTKTAHRETLGQKTVAAPRGSGSIAAQVHHIWEMGNVTCEKLRFYSRKSWQIKYHGAGNITWKRHSVLGRSWRTNRRTLLLLPVCGDVATLVLEASFSNSKHFKTAVKSTVTFSPKIVSCEKNNF